jgi:hypothetical protein
MSLEALKRPFSARALPGLLIVLIPIMEFFGMGYKMACARTAMSQNYELPRWKNFKELFIFGVLARFIQLIWLTPAAIMFFVAYAQVKSVASAITTANLQTLSSIQNALFYFIIFLVIAVIFIPASVMNFVAEAKFKSAFSFSMLKRMASKAYLVGWLASSFYVILIVGIFVSALLLVGGFAPSLSTLLASIIILPAELIFFWLPGITYWTLLGEYWGKSINREYQPTQ